MTDFRDIIFKNTKIIIVIFGIIIMLIFLLLIRDSENTKSVIINTNSTDSNFVNLWSAPAQWRFDMASNKDTLNYGKELIMHTAKYFGPKGKINPISNGMNCQNCHLDAGTKAWGNNYFAVFATYPKFRARSGTVENLEKRINDCFERSLNGNAITDDSKEMKAMKAYINFLGQDVEKKQTPNGTGIYKLALLNRAASPEKGKVAYETQCAVCHKSDGSGVLSPEKNEFTYPPLWGNHSFNNGAGLNRISNMAGYIKMNMPFGINYEKPTLSDEEAWDISAYIVSQKRPEKDMSKDWPDISKKPFDHPFGPYSDNFSEIQHKFGPFKEIKKFYKK